MKPTIQEILDVLNRERVRATYGAVGAVLGVIARDVSRQLGERRPEASWVVAADTLRPSGYGDDQLHPELLASRVVNTEAELLALLGRSQRILKQNHRDLGLTLYITRHDEGAGDVYRCESHDGRQIGRRRDSVEGVQAEARESLMNERGHTCSPECEPWQDIPEA